MYNTKEIGMAVIFIHSPVKDFVFLLSLLR